MAKIPGDSVDMPQPPGIAISYQSPIGIVTEHDVGEAIGVVISAAATAAQPTSPVKVSRKEPRKLQTASHSQAFGGVGSECSESSLAFAEASTLNTALAYLKGSEHTCVDCAAGPAGPLL